MDHRIALVAALIACGGGQKPAPPPDSATTTAPTPAAPQDSGAAPPRAPQPTLSAIDATADSGFDRFVFEFAGDAPGYHVEYRNQSVRCGSGDPVSVQGAASLVVRFEPARAHDDDGHPTLPAREGALGLPALTEWKLICDFEGQVEFLIGVTAMAPYRMTTQATPAGFILEVKHAP
jgi:hypothetical protein